MDDEDVALDWERLYQIGKHQKIALRLRVNDKLLWLDYNKNNFLSLTDVMQMRNAI